MTYVGTAGTYFEVAGLFIVGIGLFIVVRGCSFSLNIGYTQIKTGGSFTKIACCFKVVVGKN